MGKSENRKKKEASSSYKKKALFFFVKFFVLMGLFLFLELLNPVRGKTPQEEKEMGWIMRISASKIVMITVP